MVKDATDFINFVSWRQSAEYLAQYGHRGDIVAAAGQLQVREWTDKDGNKRKAFEVNTTGVELLSSKKDSQASNNATQPQNVRPGSYTGPQQGFGQPQQVQPQYNQQGFQNLEGFDGQLPF
jgi:single-strand DNA-binding protein